jgi:hypothetical protein
MFALISLLIVISLSMLVIRIGTLALGMTGMSREAAAFQSLSAFSGTGFTTGEAEMVINAPERRRIISYLISIGSGGAISAIASLVLSFTSAGEAATPRLLILAGGIALLTLLAQSEWFNRILTPAIKWALRRTTSLDVRDFASLLHLRDNHGVAELEVSEGDWLAKARLKDLNLPGEGVVVLGILRGDGSYVGAPSLESELRPGDTLIAYGRDERLQELAVRSETDHSSHEQAVADHSNRDAVAICAKPRKVKLNNK